MSWIQSLHAFYGNLPVQMEMQRKSQAASMPNLSLDLSAVGPFIIFYTNQLVIQTPLFIHQAPVNRLPTAEADAL